MNIAEFSIRKSVITVSLTVVLLIAGIVSFNNLARLEDPEFTIKEAIIVTPYPGASAAEVEEEVSNLIEMACQEMGQIKRVQSTSSRGISNVKIVIQDQYDRPKMPAVWDELRRKLSAYEPQLPPGAGPIMVNDDFGDVYGIYLALSGEGYAYKELYEVAKMLKRELLRVEHVKKVVLYGVQPEVIWVEMSRAKMAALGISQDDIYRALSAKNLPADAGSLELPPEYIPINPTGEYTSEKEFGDLLISARGSDSRVYLKDVATVRRGYQEPPSNLLRYDGHPGIGIGVSTVQGGNVVAMGEGIDRKLKDLESQIPAGIEIDAIAHQAWSVVESINGFVVNLIQAIAIVFVVLLFAMGMRSGFIIGGVLFLTIAGTFLFMSTEKIILERISLGALIIALGMLVDNAIVVIDGMKVRIEQGMDRIKAASEVVGQTAIPLLGATVIAVLAFASIGTSDDSTGEYCRSLFQVILISLTLSWVTAVTITPLLGKWMLKGKASDGDEKDPYGGGLFRGYKKLLVAAIKLRWVTVAVVVGIFVVSLTAFGYVDQMFFPNSTRPQYFVECYFPEGTHINDTSKELEKAEAYLRELDGVTHVVSQVGGGDPRFLLTYVPGKSKSSYGVLLIDVDDAKKIVPMLPKVQSDLDALFPQAVMNVRTFLLGPGEGGKIQLRIFGSDRTLLRQLARKATDIMHADPQAKGVRDEWKEKVKVVRPQMAEAQARDLGITRPALAEALQTASSGRRTGVYREGEELLPIIARAPAEERVSADSLQDVQIWSPVAQAMVPVRQILTGFTTETEDANILRRYRTTMIKIHCDPKTELASKLFARIKAPIEQALGADLNQYFGRKYGTDEDPYAGHDASTIKVIDEGKIPLRGLPGYYMAWGGEAEDSSRAQASLATTIPIFVGMMVLIVICLFNSIKQTLVIWLTVPLAVIGVAWGLLLFGQPFGFMALLGLLSLVGMLIKNSIVLVDQINLEMSSGKEPFTAIVDSGLSRMSPVMLAAGTTILGMVPLLKDAFFISMAVTIMCGLLVASVLTLVFVPVLYAIFYGVRPS